MQATGTGQAIGRYPNSDAAVIVGNGGRTLLSVHALPAHQRRGAAPVHPERAQLPAHGRDRPPRAVLQRRVAGGGRPVPGRRWPAWGSRRPSCRRARRRPPTPTRSSSRSCSTGNFDLVIFQQRFWFDGAARLLTPLVNHVNGGGRVLWTTWNRTQVFAAMAPVFTAFGPPPPASPTRPRSTRSAPSRSCRITTPSRSRPARRRRWPCSPRAA